LNYLSATRIHNGRTWLPGGSIIETEPATGAVKALHEPGTVDPGKVHHYEGILCPGFVNVHCHLELSHMKGAIAEGGRLVPFLQSVMTGRGSFPEEEKNEAIAAALAEMRRNGIVAVGDIANGTDSLAFRPGAGLHIHTFVESIGFTEAHADARFEWAVKVYGQFAAQAAGQHRLRQSIVPHAPYSVSEQLFARINKFAGHSLISIHNEETAAELELYRDKTGAMLDLYRTLNIDAGFFKASGKTSLQTYLPYLDESHPLILVHNTFMQPDDLLALKESAREVYLCICPNANWYIERQLPPLDAFRSSGLPLCIGTDSLASNHALNIWGELQTLQQHFPAIDLGEMLCWATYNGACALQMEDTLGSIEPGRRCGIVHIDASNRVSMVVSG